MADAVDEDMLLECLDHDDVKYFQASPNTHSLRHTQWLVGVFEIIETFRVLCLVNTGPHQQICREGCSRQGFQRSYRTGACRRACSKLLCWLKQEQGLPPEVESHQREEVCSTKISVIP